MIPWGGFKATGSLPLCIGLYAQLAG